jgi:hypothetical protein
MNANKKKAREALLDFAGFDADADRAHQENDVVAVAHTRPDVWNFAGPPTEASERVLRDSRSFAFIRG